ncbi:MAG: PadR family transcriptional regulator [Gemmatimonadetes bacterium]|nr:PadR family transcriptional regulator [Gemmatimonadota bacterium]
MARGSRFIAKGSGGGVRRRPRPDGHRLFLPAAQGGPFRNGVQPGPNRARARRTGPATRYETISVSIRRGLGRGTVAARWGLNGGRRVGIHGEDPIDGAAVELETLTPLKPAWFHILLSLSQEPMHGFAIRETVETRTGGKLRLWPATLYGAIREMSELGLIEPLEGDDDPDDDQRRRYHALTARGHALLRWEAERLQSLVDAVRAAQG